MNDEQLTIWKEKKNMGTSTSFSFVTFSPHVLLQLLFFCCRKYSDLTTLHAEPARGGHAYK
jgi:hypothetical protein